MGITFDAKVFFNDDGDKKIVSNGKKLKKESPLPQELSNYRSGRLATNDSRGLMLCRDCDRANKIFESLDKKGENSDSWGIAYWDKDGKIHVQTKYDTDLPGEHELLDAGSCKEDGYKRVIVNDEQGRRVSQTVKTKDGKVVCTQKTEYGKDQVTNTYYDANGKRTGYDVRKYDSDGVTLKSIEYRDGKGRLLFVERDGNYYDAKGRKITTAQALKLSERMYPHTQECKDYYDSVQRQANRSAQKLNRRG